MYKALFSLKALLHHHHHHHPPFAINTTGTRKERIMVQMSQKEQDIQMMLAAGCHLGTKNVNFQMERYGKIYEMHFIKIKDLFCVSFFLSFARF